MIREVWKVWEVWKVCEVWNVVRFGRSRSSGKVKRFLEVPKDPGGLQGQQGVRDLEG